MLTTVKLAILTVSAARNHAYFPLWPRCKLGHPGQRSRATHQPHGASGQCVFIRRVQVVPSSAKARPGVEFSGVREVSFSSHIAVDVVGLLKGAAWPCCESSMLDFRHASCRGFLLGIAEALSATKTDTTLPELSEQR